LTNPGLYTSNISGVRVRNVVLEGDNWKYVAIGGGGVIVSVNTPVRNMNGYDPLWYVVQGQSSTHDCVARVSVLEITSSVSVPNKLVAPSAAYNLTGLIRATNTQSIDGDFKIPSARDYYPGSPNGARPSVTWQQWAAGVISGTVPAL
jgi:hypothetical protein